MNYPLIFIACYFIIMNFFAFILYFADKKKAQHHSWRISESALLAAAFVGGSIGAYAAMKLFRHKTKHPKFYILVPLMIILHIVLIGFIFTKINPLTYFF